MKKLSYISEDFKNVGALYALKQDNKIVYIGCTKDIYNLLELKDYEESLNLAIYIKKAK